MRRASIPVAYSEGFSPHPKLSFGLALPTGHESLGEYLDVDVTESLGDPIDVGAFITRLDPGLPIGLDVQAAAEIAPGTQSLQQAVELLHVANRNPGPRLPPVGRAGQRRPRGGLDRRHP